MVICMGLYENDFGLRQKNVTTFYVQIVLYCRPIVRQAFNLTNNMHYEGMTAQLEAEGERIKDRKSVV